jgi:hypothetical protein
MVITLPANKKLAYLRFRDRDLFNVDLSFNGTRLNFKVTCWDLRSVFVDKFEQALTDIL